jgi:hypothetical protein
MKMKKRRKSRTNEPTLKLKDITVGVCLVRTTDTHDFAVVVTPSGRVEKFRSCAASTAFYKARKFALQVVG